MNARWKWLRQPARCVAGGEFRMLILRPRELLRVIEDDEPGVTINHTERILERDLEMHLREHRQVHANELRHTAGEWAGAVHEHR